MAKPKQGLPADWADPVDAEWTLPEVQRLLKASAAKKSRSGPSGVSSSLLHRAPELMQVAVTDLFEAMRTHWVTPDALVVGHIQPLRKDNKKPALADSRPITLLEDLLKVYTKGLADRIQACLKATPGVLDPAQYGFLFNATATQALWNVEAMLEDAKQHGKEFYALLVDVRKAYDSAQFWSLELAARRIGLPEGTIQWLADFDRKSRSRVIYPGGLTDDFACGGGVRQGDSLSPLRYVIFMDMLLSYMSEKCQDPYQLETIAGPLPKQAAAAAPPPPTAESTRISAQGFVDDLLPVSSTQSTLS
eukprot:g1663.t1